MRVGLLKCPNLVPLFATRPSITVSALKQAEEAFSILQQAAFKKSEAIFAYQSVCIYVLAHMQAEVGRVPGTQGVEEFLLNSTEDINLEKAVKI